MTARIAICAFLLLGLSACMSAPLNEPHSTRARGFVQSNGTKVYYEEEGAGQTVILIHGGWLNARQWNAQMPALSRHYRVVRYDFRGAGRSPLGDSAYAHFEDLAALLAQLRIDRAHRE